MLKRRHMLLGLAASPFFLNGCGGAAGSGRRTKLVFGEQRGIRPMAEVSKVMDGAPYDFQWATFATPSVIFEAFRSGAIDMASSNDITILNAAANGVKFKIVGALRGGLLKNVGIVVRKGLPVRTVGDLKGRKVIVSSARGGSGDNMLRAALFEAGVSERDVAISYAPFTDGLSAFRSDALDILVTNDPYLILAEQHGGTVIRNGEGLNAGLALVVASDAALGDPDKRRAIGDTLTRLAKGVAWSQAHEVEYARYYSAAYGVDLPLVRQMNARAKLRLEPVDRHTIALTQSVADNLVKRGFWSKTLAVAPFFDTATFAKVV